jgi:hypothetical protein
MSQEKLDLITLLLSAVLGAFGGYLVVKSKFGSLEDRDRYMTPGIIMVVVPIVGNFIVFNVFR